MDTQTSPFASLVAENYASLTTFRKNGIAVATAMWFSIENNTIYISTGATSGKVKRIRHTNHVTLALCTSSGKVTGPAIDATASIISDPQELARAEASLAKKYGFQRRALNFIRRIALLLGRPNEGSTYLRIEPQS
jgi:PPOX class probable F420-dependent enzyme